MLGNWSRTRCKRVAQNLAILILTAGFAHPGRTADSVPQELPPEEEQAALRRAEATGLTIFKHDHAAAVATDALGAPNWVAYLLPATTDALLTFIIKDSGLTCGWDRYY